MSINLLAWAFYGHGMANEPVTWGKTLIAIGIFAALTALPALAYWYEQWDEVRNAVPGTTVVTDCSDRGCVGRFTSDDGVVELDAVPLGPAPGSVRMWLSPREAMPEPQPPRMWPTSAYALAAALGPQLFFGLQTLAYWSARRRDRDWPPTGWAQALTNQVFLVIIVGGMLAWCGGLGAASTPWVRTPGHVVGVECPESGCVGRFVSDDGTTDQAVDVSERPAREGPVRAWLEDGVVMFDAPVDPVQYLVIPLIGMVAFDIWLLVDFLQRRRVRSRT
jgi:hypothetical protein